MISMIKSFSLFALGATAALATEYKTPPAILDPSSGTTWVQKYQESRKALIDAPFIDAEGNADNVHCYRLDLVGDVKQRGFAHGALLAREIEYFVNVGLNKYYIDMVMGIDLNLDGLPEALQALFHALKVKGALKAPEVFNAALEWVYNNEEKFMPKALIDEMNAIGEGMCHSLGPNCNVTQQQLLVKRVNMLPELIRMACTALVLGVLEVRVENLSKLELLISAVVHSAITLSFKYKDQLVVAPLLQSAFPEWLVSSLEFLRMESEFLKKFG